MVVKSSSAHVFLAVFNAVGLAVLAVGLIFVARSPSRTSSADADTTKGLPSVSSGQFSDAEVRALANQVEQFKKDRRSGVGEADVVAALSTPGTLNRVLVALMNSVGSGYDYSTPEQMLRSTHLAIVNGDFAEGIRVGMQIFVEDARRKAKEFLDTLKVARKVEYEGDTYLFVAFDKDGLPTQEVQIWRRKGEFWEENHSRYETMKRLGAVSYGDGKKLADLIIEWEGEGSLVAQVRKEKN